MARYDRLGNNIDLAIADERYDLDEDRYTPPTLPEDDDGFSPEREAMEDECGAQWGDPRRCPKHPHVKTSSDDGMFDADCGECEYESEMEYQKMKHEQSSDKQDDIAPVAPKPTDDDDIPF